LWKSGFDMKQNTFYYKEEIGFINYWESIFDGSFFDPERKNIDTDFTGLSKNGQKYLSNLLSKTATLYLLEKGGLVKGNVVRNNKRIIDYSLINYPLRFSFSNSIYLVLKHIYLDTDLSSDKLKFDSADHIILLYILENNFKMEYGKLLKNKEIRLLLKNSILSYMFFFDKCNTTDESGEKHERKIILSEFEKSIDMFALFFSLRFFLRDIYFNMMNDILKSENCKDLIIFGKKQERIILSFFEYIKTNDLYELFEPFCQIYELLFMKMSHIELIKNKIDIDISVLYTSDNIKIRKEILTFYNWINEIESISKQSLKTYSYDEDFEKMSLFKKFYSEISSNARENAKKTIQYLENKV